MRLVKVHKLTSTDAFMVLDLGDASASVGMVRSAPKILQEGAKNLARANTYSFASFEMQVGGASGGINARPPDRAEAVRAFVEELQPMVAEGQLKVDQGKGVDPADLAALREVDGRSALLWETTDGITLADELTALGAVTAAQSCAGGLDGRTVAVEGFGPVQLSLCRQVAATGARVVSIATAAGSVSDKAGFDPVAVSAAWAAKGDDLVNELGSEVKPAWAGFGAEADLLFPGSKAGALTHDGAPHVKASAVIPIGPIPVTTKAFATLKRAGITVVPDFVCLAGPLLTIGSDAGSADEMRSLVRSAIADSLAEVADHEDGPLLAAAYRAETFLRTWQDDLPFGRPLA